jgi:N-acetylglucosaminyldiphosphoundecaprenol N-acetyl-beta-D-mannosaminyltransferase
MLKERPQIEKPTPFFFAGVKIDRYDVEDSFVAVLRNMKDAVRVYFVNAHAVNVAQKSLPYKEALSRAEFVFNDGAGVSLAGTFLGSPFPANLNGTDWIPAFLDFLDAQGEGLNIFLLGDSKETLEKTSDIFSQRWPSLHVVGSHHGYYQHTSEPLEALWDVGVDLLIVGMGVPKQELFIDDHWETLKNAGVKGAIAGGAIFKFLTGEVYRAPQWLRKCRLEWIWRLLLEPKRLWRRYLLGNFTFMMLVWKESRKNKKT